MFLDQHAVAGNKSGAFQHKEHVKSSYFPNNMKGLSIHIATRGWPTKENGGAGINYNSSRVIGAFR